MRNDIECEPPLKHKAPEPPNSGWQSVMLNVDKYEASNYVRRNLAHIKTASAIAIALAPMSKSEVGAAPSA